MVGDSRIELGLECDVHFSADDQLICLHDLKVDRTATSSGYAFGLTVAELKRLDFGSRRFPEPTAEQRELVTLLDLMIMVRDARALGVPVRLVIETKHPNRRGLDVERRVAAMLADFGWDSSGSPVMVISFSPAAVRNPRPAAGLAEGCGRVPLLRWGNRRLPEGIKIIGPDLELIKTHLGFVARAQAHGNEVHVWTVNAPDDIRFCRDLGVTSRPTIRTGSPGYSRSSDPIRLIVGRPADHVRRGDARVHQVRDHALGRVLEVVAVVHPDARGCRRRRRCRRSPRPRRSASRSTTGCRSPATPLRASTTAWWPCRCIGCTSPLWLSMCMVTMSPSRTTNIGTFG